MFIPQATKFKYLLHRETCFLNIILSPIFLYAKSLVLLAHVSLGCFFFIFIYLHIITSGLTIKKTTFTTKTSRHKITHGMPKCDIRAILVIQHLLGIIVLMMIMISMIGFNHLVVQPLRNVLDCV